METVVGVLACIGGLLVIVSLGAALLAAWEGIAAKFRCPEMPACDECGVLFKPRGFGSHYPNLCKDHAEKARTLDLRKGVVRAWADAHWESLEKKAKAWDEKRNKELHHRNEQYGMLSGGGLAAQQAAACQQTPRTGGFMPIPIRGLPYGLR